MGGPKNGEYTNLALVSLTGGDAVPATPAAAADGDGVPLLADPFGRLYVNAMGGGGGFMTRVTVPSLLSAQGATRQMFIGGGILDSFEVHLSSIALAVNALIADTLENVPLAFLQVFDTVGVPVGLALASYPIQGNRQILSIDSGIEVAAGAVLALSLNGAGFVPFPAGPPLGTWYSQGVGFI